MNDPVPGLTVYQITMKQARELPGPQQDIDGLRQALWQDVELTAIGPAIASRRRELGILQKDLAEFVGVDDKYLSHIETGRIAFTPLHIKSIALHLGTTVDALKYRARFGSEVHDEAA